MAAKPRKPFLLRISPQVLSAVERLAAAEFRSANVQVEVLLREALAKRGIAIKPESTPESTPEDES
ncbi:hypothetical protein [Aquidulcibacter sp.]|uniref:hypothetical protein n=1 Tax=Aquidulcibacter sp. TaxID=2052990 RepID=UPI0025BB75B6|nr:hypothetical protein [Aquidulcibacter sp.]MCA3697518.1 toxin-antitoxin system HicB family antitoxin [Aquidulcibacter sp.]